MNKYLIKRTELHNKLIPAVLKWLQYEDTPPEHDKPGFSKKYVASQVRVLELARAIKKNEAQLQKTIATLKKKARTEPTRYCSECAKTNDDQDHDCRIECNEIEHGNDIRNDGSDWYCGECGETTCVVTVKPIKTK